ncbi:MAG: flavodoxin domain-containing protein [Thermoproteota archaeon]|nr:flavodoxin domain-containing protein [Candidatus Brockarchaeota archaeon]
MEVKLLIVYDSYTGNTEEMAKAVAEGAEKAGAKVVLKKVEEVIAEDFMEYDGFAFGTPTHCGTMSSKMNMLFTKVAMPAWGRMKGKVGAAFSSSGGLGGGNEMACLSLILTILNYGMLVFGIPDYVAPGVTLHYGAVSVGRPKEDVLKACRLLGERLAEYTFIVKRGMERYLRND